MRSSENMHVGTADVDTEEIAPVPPSEAADTIPDINANGELLEAIEWLKEQGVVSVDSKPAFATFFDELAERKAG